MDYGVVWDRPEFADRQTQVVFEVAGLQPLEHLIQLEEALGNGEVLIEKRQRLHQLLQDDSHALSQQLQEVLSQSLDACLYFLRDDTPTTEKSCQPHSLDPLLRRRRPG